MFDHLFRRVFLLYKKLKDVEETMQRKSSTLPQVLTVRIAKILMKIYLILIERLPLFIGCNQTFFTETWTQLNFIYQPDLVAVISMQKILTDYSHTFHLILCVTKRPFPNHPLQLRVEDSRLSTKFNITEFPFYKICPQ